MLYAKYLLARAKRRLARKKNIILSQGVHAICALMGGGKTMLVNYMLQEYVDDKSFLYVSDRAHTDALADNRAVYCDIIALFADGRQKYRLPLKIDDRRCKGIVIDELALQFNRRNNKSKSYNDVFLGLVEMIISLRHQGINSIYIISQSYDIVDIQLQLLIKYKHDIYSYKRYSYAAYKATQQLLYLPRKLKIITHIKDNSNTYNKSAAQTIKIDYAKHVASYNHLARRLDYNSLPLFTLQKDTSAKN